MKPPYRTRQRSIWEQSERIATYAVLVSLILAELVSVWSKPVDRWLSGHGATILLAAALLLVYSMIDDQLQRITGSIAPRRFGEIIAEMAKQTLNGDARVLANDGSKYLALIDDSKLRIRKLQLMVWDTSQTEKWARLVDRGLIDSMEVRQLSEPPRVSVMIKDDRALMGLFVRDHAGASLQQTLSVDGRSTGGRAFLKDLRTFFESEWRAAKSPSLSQGAQLQDRPPSE
jgi:hypothetical protein